MYLQIYVFSFEFGIFRLFLSINICFFRYFYNIPLALLG